ncbi:effector-associated constant component EACC1 [Micromonosporaceae bacterium Da 78-11]
MLTISMQDRLELNGLYTWLRHDTGVAGAATVSMSSSGHATGEQGTLDIIEVVLANATAIGGLAVSIANWRMARRRENEIIFRRGEHEVGTKAADAGTIEKTIRDLPPDPGPSRADDDGTPTPGPKE